MLSISMVWEIPAIIVVKSNITAFTYVCKCIVTMLCEAELFVTDLIIADIKGER